MLTAFLLLFSLAFGQEPAATPAESPDVEAAAPVVQPPVQVVAPVPTVATPAPVADTVDTPAEALGTLQTILGAAKEGKWGLAAASILMLLVWAVRTFLWKSIPAKFVPYVTVAVAAAVAFATAIGGGESVGSALLVTLAGAFTGLSAVGFWETVGRKIFGKTTQQDSLEG